MYHVACGMRPHTIWAGTSTLSCLCCTPLRRGSLHIQAHVGRAYASEHGQCTPSDVLQDCARVMLCIYCATCHTQGIVRQRLLDLLTDTLRAQLLRICGYKVDLVEFVSTEHTPRNLLIRAVKVAGSNQARNADGTSHKAQGGAGAQDVAMRAALVQEYEALKAFWGGVTPYLESLLVEQLKA